MKITLLKDKRLCAEINKKVMFTDQSVKSDGLGVYASPFDLFKASLGCCMGYYVMSFCLKKDIPLDCIWLEVNFKEEEVITEVDVCIKVDDRFPAKYIKAVLKAANACKVKKQIEASPKFNLVVENN